MTREILLITVLSFVCVTNISLIIKYFWKQNNKTGKISDDPRLTAEAETIPAAPYQLRFFFDYGCGGCLWSVNDTAYQAFGYGPLDAETYNLEDKPVDAPRILLSATLRRKVSELDELFYQSLNWEDPMGKSMWDEAQWNDFCQQAKDLYNDIVAELGSDFDIIYDQDNYYYIT